MRRRTLAAVLAGSVLAAVLVPDAAFAATGPTIGGDVSRHQADTGLPALGDFAVVAVNTGLPTETNPYLVQQLAWAAGAAGTGHAKVDVYLASANPSPAQAKWWPHGNRTRAGTTVRSPYGSCKGGATRACSWVYGNSIARDDLDRGVTGSVGRWWIDVEQDNTWSSSTTRNRAVVEGMTAGLRAAKKSVGLYALSSQVRDILGTVPKSSSVSSLPSWVAGLTTQTTALKRCSGTPLTSGRLTLVQWTEDGGLTDRDVACAVLTKAPKPKISGHYRVGRKLTAKAGTWGPGRVHLSYRWTRDGHDIAKATHATYVVKKADKRHRIAVTVTATETGYSRSIKKSASHRIAS